MKCDNLSDDPIDELMLLASQVDEMKDLSDDEKIEMFHKLCDDRDSRSKEEKAQSDANWVAYSAYENTMSALLDYIDVWQISEEDPIMPNPFAGVELLILFQVKMKNEEDLLPLVKLIRTSQPN